jgi:hypothetical protein
VSQQAGQVGISLAGAAIGAYFGVPGLGFAVGSLVGQLLLPGPDAPKQSGPRLGDSQVQISSYGTPIPLTYGTVRIAGNVIWGSQVQEVVKTESSGGKGGQPKQETETFSYRWTGAIALCANEIAGIKRIWINDQLYTDLTAPVAGSPLNLKIYTGTETQLPDPTMEAVEGVGNVPAYRGLAYVVINRFPLKGSTIPPTFHFEVVTQGATDVVAQIVPDANPTINGYVACDPDTGVVWVSKTFNDEVRVFSCDASLSLIKTIPYTKPAFLSWQPSFASVTSSLLGPNIGMIPARMWVGCNAPDGSAPSDVTGFRTDGSYVPDLVMASAMDGSYFCWPGALVVDRSTILRTLPNMNGTTVGLVGTINGACFKLKAFNLIEDPNQTSDFFAGWDGSWIADMVQGAEDGSGDGVIFVMDMRGVIRKMRLTVPNVFGLNELGVEYVEIARAQPSVTFAASTNSLAWDQEEEALYATTFTSGAGGAYYVTKYDSALNLIWQQAFSIALGTQMRTITRVRYHEGVGDIWICGTVFTTGQRLGFQRLDKSTGEVLETIIATNYNNSLYDFILYPGAQFAIGTGVHGTAKVPLLAGAIPTIPTLAEVVTDLSVRSETLEAGDVEVTTLTGDTVPGFVVAGRAPLRNILQPLLENYFVDAVEADGLVKFVKRGSLSNVVIVQGELAAHEFTSASPSPLVSQRTQENELPRALDGRFIDSTNQYKISVVHSRRLTGDSQQIRTQDIPIVIDADTSKQILDTLLFNMYADRDPKDFVLSRKYLYLTPSDVITVEDPEIGFIQLRIGRIEYHFPQVLKVQATTEDITLYSGFTFPGENTEADQINYPGATKSVPVVLDIPQLRDADNVAGVYVGAYSIGDGFSPSEVFSSTDNVSFSSVVPILNETTVANAETQLSWAGSFK